jgi:acyl-CoA thioester hydrolase
MTHRYVCPLRWGDMDAQGHLNNAAFVDYLQEARVDYLLSGPPAMHDLLATGVLVVQHQVEYLRPAVFSSAGLPVELWVDAVGGSRFVIGYAVHTDDGPALRARTSAAPYDLAAGRLRRLHAEERAVLAAACRPEEALRPYPRVRWGAGGHRYPLAVRWSDLDSYGHANNVKYYDYVQEGRIALLAEALGWSADAEAGLADVWVVVRQDVDYLRPLDFRVEPYEVVTVVTATGTRSVTLAAEIRDPLTGSVFAAARTVIVGPRPLEEGQRAALARYAAD